MVAATSAYTRVFLQTLASFAFSLWCCGASLECATNAEGQSLLQRNVERTSLESAPAEDEARERVQFMELQNDSLCDEYDQRLISVLATITVASKEDLQDISYVAELIRQVGLVEDFRPLYGNESVYQLHVHGNRTLAKGIGSAGMYQLPAQMACALVSLSELNITTFLEVGIYTGWTGVFMSAYLSRFNQGFQSVGVDIVDFQSNCVKVAMSVMNRKYVEISQDEVDGAAELVNVANGLRKNETHVDLCFIDGDHSYDGVHHDVETLHSSCKYVMLHDVVDRDCPGVRQQWAELIDDNATQVVARCFQQPSGLNGTYANTYSLGIGVAQLALS
mmetsp:Transcript_20630/g.47309  ORF Transcript_20630/g.47309 Transcript_20630/m.47309 type:complete len:334 (-) Transcript_20630:91-1092(-)